MAVAKVKLPDGTWAYIGMGPKGDQIDLIVWQNTGGSLALLTQSTWIAGFEFGR